MSSWGLLRSCAARRSEPAPLLLRKALVWPLSRAGQASMLLWVSVLVLAPVSAQSEAASKPVISLHPPWTVVFIGETVTLTCNVSHFLAPEKRRHFLWYRQDVKLDETLGNTLQAHASGQYRCQTQDSLLSDYVSLTFSSANLILQGPPSVFEGDSVVLRCRANTELALKTITFYRRGEVLTTSDDSSDFHIKQAGLKHNGDYHCSGVKNDSSYTSNSVHIQVQELFPRPRLTDSSSWTVSGKSVALTCETQLPPQRSHVKLWFHFFRDNHMLHWGLENFLKISTITTRGRDASNYWCKACKWSSDVCKQSPKFQLPVLIPVSRPVLTLSPRGHRVLEGHTVTLSCKVERGSFPIWYQFLREEVVIHKMEATQATKPLMSLKAEHSGNYYCTADNGLGAQRSIPVYLTVTVPVSRPVLTLSPREASVPEGHTVTLSCKAERASPPIMYKFYHEDVSLGERSARSTGVSLRVTVTAKESGNYFCTADNGFGPQRSETKSLSVKEQVALTRTDYEPEATLLADHQLFSCFPAVAAAASEALPSLCLMTSATPEGRSDSGCDSLVCLSLCPSAKPDGSRQTAALTASRPVLTIRKPRAQAVEGDVVELHCKAPRGSPPILYRFYHKDNAVGSSWVYDGGGAFFNLPLTAEHSGEYACEADNGLGTRRSETVSLSVKGQFQGSSLLPDSGPLHMLPVCLAESSCPASLVDFRCLVRRRSLTSSASSGPWDDTLHRTLVSICVRHPRAHPARAVHVFAAHPAPRVAALAERGRVFLTLESPAHSAPPGTYLESQPAMGKPGCRGPALASTSVCTGAFLHPSWPCLNTTFPASCPALTLRVPGAQAQVGDVVELRCEAQRGSPPLLYRFYREDIPLGNSSAPAGGGASFNLSLTAEHSGNYSCEADNGLGAQRSEAVSLSISGLAGSISGPIATGITGGLFSALVFGVVALLLYCRRPRKAGGRPTSEPSRSPADSDAREPTYHNVPTWLELQPVYSNVNPKGGEVVYTEVRRGHQGDRPAANSDSALLFWTHLPSRSQAASHRPADPQGSSVIYSQVKAARPPASTALRS
ncbi:LOW QUALITY PROTEIN: Fc receptor-like protein 5 [Suricata suricatta]|uniref:LOW QUALITY PROTEIN: Fc receptor-like protein 5 n=1 Tax=Suricata suricatta TaxID=37032 RepID=UPI0011552B68|nr:LOW QUALITY PROTEIN: Fc receptor-like protein 5 [Suricata suricatta]